MEATVNRSRAGADRTNIDRQLGLLGPGAWALSALYCLVYLAIATFDGGEAARSPWGIVLVVALMIAALVLANPGRLPLHPGRTILVIAVVIAAVGFTLGHLPVDAPPTVQTWELGAANFLLFGLALRRRILVAWLAEALMVATVVVWSTIRTGSPAFGLSFTYGQPISLLAGTVFVIALHRTAARIVRYREAEEIRAAVAARERTGAEVSDRELELVRSLAVPTLESIVEGDGVNELTSRVLEAELRDYIRGRSLVSEPLRSTLRIARNRGVDVALLDDAGERSVPTSTIEGMLNWAAHQVSVARADSLTLRLAWREGQPILTLSADGHDTAEFTS